MLVESAHLANEVGEYEWAAAYLQELVIDLYTFNEEEREAFETAYLGAAKDIHGKLAAIDRYREREEGYQIFNIIGDNLLSPSLTRDVNDLFTNGHKVIDLHHLGDAQYDQEDEVFYSTLKGRLYKIEYDCFGDQVALTYAEEQFERAWSASTLLSPSNPIVWKLAMANAFVLKITAFDDAVDLLKTTISEARKSESEPKFDESDPEFQQMLKMY